MSRDDCAINAAAYVLGALEPADPRRTSAT